MMSWDDVKPIMRPTPGTVKMGVMKADAEKCTKCGLCIVNCPFRAWEKDEHDVPRMKEEHECFSCSNCMVVCPVGAISIVDTYHVDSGFFASDSPRPPYRMPYEPKNAAGDPDEWNLVEKLVLERRSVRNFKPDPVPESLIRRVLEAGRFAPTSGNCQPWKFVVITDKSLIKELDEACYGVMSMMYATYVDDELVMGLIPFYEEDRRPGIFDPRMISAGLKSVVNGIAPVFHNAPVVILIACDQRAIGGPETQAAIAGTNMNLVAMSLGLGFCWIGFSQVIEMVPDLKDKLGLKYPFFITMGMALGYPKFKQHGSVSREFRPITWFREGAGGPEIET